MGRLAGFLPAPGFSGWAMTCAERGQPSGIPLAHEVRPGLRFRLVDWFPGGDVCGPLDASPPLRTVV